MPRYIVKAAAVVAKLDSETGEGYFYRNDLLPEGGSERTKNDHARLAGLGLVAEVEVEAVPVTIVVPVEVEDEPKPLGEMTVDELTAYASENSIDVGRATTEDGIRSKIIEAEQA